MKLNANFDERVVIHTQELEWQASPMPGVHRRMLDRIGDEVARATSIVRYAPGSHFSPHVHTGGEEFMVLEGVFEDEHGKFPAGSYLRNPPQSSHTPGSEDGCTIFVKLWQFAPDDRTHVRLRYDEMEHHQDSLRPNVGVTPLYQDDRETVQVERWAPNGKVQLDLPEGGEFLVLEGGFSEAQDSLTVHSWLRVPLGGKLDATAGAHGATVWVKTRHLRFVDPPELNR